MMSFFEELRRRNVFRVGIAYAVVAWLLAQVAELALGAFGAPDWVLQAVLVLLAIGFPLALFFAWAFELTPEGVKRERDVERSRSITKQTGRRLDRVIIGVLIVAVGMLLANRFYDRSPASERQSIAVLPFVNMSGDDDNFVDGLTEELLNVLASNPDLKVAGRTSSFAFKGHTGDFSTIGDVLNVDHVLEGSVRRSDDMIRVTAQLITVDDGFHLWSDTYERPMTDIFEIQDEVSASIARELKVRLIPPSKRPTENIEAYTYYLTAKALLNSQISSPEEILSVIDLALDIDPQFAEAYEFKAYVYWYSVASPEIEIAVHEAANAALELDPDLVGARALATISHPIEWSWVIEFEAIEAAVAAKPTDFLLVGTLCYDLLMVGYRQESVRCARRMIEIEPLSPLAHWREGYALGALARQAEARDSYLKSIELGNPWRWRELTISHLVDGDYEQALRAAENFPQVYAWSMDEVRELIENVVIQGKGFDFLEPWVTAQANRASVFWEANLAYQWLLVFGYLDEYWRVIERYADQTESAWTQADALEMLGTAFPSTGYTAHPKYIEYGSRWGLTDLWDKRGKPDMCDKIDGEWVCE